MAEDLILLFFVFWSAFIGGGQVVTEVGQKDLFRAG